MLKPVYALIGEDSFLQLQKLDTLLRQLGPDAQRIDCDGERAELAEVFDELRCFAMFGGSKIVVMQNADAFLTRFREQLEKYVANPASNATLILRLTSLPANQRIYKAIAKIGGIELCQPPKPRDLPRWITDHARSAHKLAVSPDAASMLANLIGSDLGRLDCEIAKLALQAKDGKLSVHDITASVVFQREQEMWDLTNALGENSPAEAVRRWRHLLQSDPSAEFRAVTWLTMWLENARKALALRKQGMRGFDICKQLKIWPNEIQEPFIKTVSALGQTGVTRALDLLAEIDHQSKSGVGEAADNVERFLLSLKLPRR